MERIKLLQHKAPLFIIAIILFLIPFFWFKPGEMDLGGDSGRLYFYDPVSYFFTSTLYTVSSSSVGGPTLSYVNIPFIYLLIVLKYIFTSPTILISGFYGISLSFGFIFCYLTIMELTESKNNSYAAIAGGLVYVFFPALIDTWRHTLLTFNQVFLNPLIFYLLLMYFKTSRISILFGIVIITFIFSTNFNFFAAPGLFAFYPISILFLVLYTRIILKRKIILKHILLNLFLFLGIQVFHLILLIGSIFSFGNNANTAIFSDAGKFDRGLSYFSAIAPSIKASINLLALPQNSTLEFFSNMFVVFPFILIVGLLYNKGNSFASSNRQKTILLTTFFFLIVLFFTTANITDTWLFIYKWLFNIPGFSMFRNFFGQWIYAYMFFYSILFGQAFYIVLYTLHYSQSRLKKLLTLMLISVPVFILVINAIPLIKGNIVRQPIWQSNNVEWVLKMDPDYEQALLFVRSLPAEGRVLTLPLTDYGYQIIAGENGGAYLGPSAISYLAGKKDFSGYNELLGYQDLMPNLIKRGEIETFKRILGVINVKYVFYDADPIVYDQFPNFPYRRTGGLPQDQHEYKEFIDSLNLHEIKNINNKFFIYEIPNDYYLPQVSVAKRSLIFNEPIAEIQTPLSLITKDNRIAINTNEENLGNRLFVSEIKFDDILLKAQNKSHIFDFFKLRKPSKFFSPFVSQKPSSVIYPLVVLREERDLEQYHVIDDTYIDRSIFFAEKRINELDRWAREIPLLGDVKSITELGSTWREPKLMELSKYKGYNSWEIALVRYEQAIEKLINIIEQANQSIYPTITNKVELRRILKKHKNKLRDVINGNSAISIEENKYLLSLVEGMFIDIFARLNLNLPDDRFIPYEIGNPLENGRYGVYVNKDDIKNLDITLSVAGKKISPKASEAGEWIRFNDVIVENKPPLPITLTINKNPNLIEQTKWNTAEQTRREVFKQNETGEDLATLAIIYSSLNDTSGLVRDISEWTGDSIYTISFEYITYNQNFSITLYERVGAKTNQYVNNTYDESLRSKEWKKFSTAILSKKDAQSAFLQITKDQDYIPDQNNGENVKKLDIRNLSIVKIPNPKIILRKVNTINDQDKKIPQITFTRINLTKYQLEVQNATVPYTLVLVNQFNEKWRLVDPTQNTSTIKGSFSRFMANMGEIGVSILGKENGIDKNTILTYFDGDIRENVGKDIFLNEKTFETWGKEEIGRYKHYPVNGLANAWYIEPSDMGNKTNYNLIIEMSSQKLLYAGLLISISTAIFTLLLLVKFLKK